MSLQVSLHGPQRADASTFWHEGRDHGCVDIVAEDGQKIAIYTTPEKARAIADAINGTASVEVAA